MLNSGWRGLTGSEVIGSPRAALLLLSSDYAWIRSHENIRISPTVFRDLLLGRPIRWLASSNGTVVVKAFDYIHRPDFLDTIDPLEFFECYQRVTLSSQRRVKRAKF